MVRYINLGHLLLLTEAQKSELGDFAESLESRFGRWARDHVATVPVLRYVLLLDREGALLDILGNPKKTFTNIMGAMTDVFQIGKCARARHFLLSAVPSAPARRSAHVPQRLLGPNGN